MTPVRLRLRAARESAGITQQALAEAVGVRQATISDLETGKAKVLRLDLLDALAKALRVDARDLIEETGERRGRRA